MGRYAFLLAAAISLFGALIQLIAPLAGPDWYAFFHAPKVMVASARHGTALAPAGSVVIGLLMVVCALYALAGAGASRLRWLPFAAQAQGTIAAVCLLRGLLFVLQLLKFPALVSAFDVLAALTWLVAGVAFLLGILVRQPAAAAVAAVAPAASASDIGPAHGQASS